MNIKELQKQKDNETLDFVANAFYETIKGIENYKTKTISDISTIITDFDLNNGELEFVEFDSGKMICYYDDEANETIYLIKNPLAAFENKNADSFVEFDEHKKIFPQPKIISKNNVAASILQMKNGNFVSIDSKNKIWD